jgi:hypothetical protein
MWPDFDDGVTKGDTAVTFQMVFGILFPAMTGIMAGTNMSGTYLLVLSPSLLTYSRLCVLLYSFSLPLLYLRCH